MSLNSGEVSEIFNTAPPSYNDVMFSSEIEYPVAEVSPNSNEDSSEDSNLQIFSPQNENNGNITGEQEQLAYEENISSQIEKEEKKVANYKKFSCLSLSLLFSSLVVAFIAIFSTMVALSNYISLSSINDHNEFILEDTCKVHLSNNGSLYNCNINRLQIDSFYSSRSHIQSGMKSAQVTMAFLATFIIFQIILCIIICSIKYQIHKIKEKINILSNLRSRYRVDGIR